jgi:stage II sporulation protein AA (anti-sigma F factor antagonist)
MSGSVSTSLIVRSLERPTAPSARDAFDLQIAIRPGTPVVAEISGEIDIASASWLREALLLAIRRHGPAICVDLQGVTFLDCSGVNVLLATRRRACLEGGWMRVIRPSARARCVITLLSLQDVLLAGGGSAGATVHLAPISVQTNRTCP